MSTLSLCLLLPALPLAAVTPRPVAGVAETALALLHYSRGLCYQIAERALDRWSRLGASDGVEAAVRDFVLHETISDLAAARSATDYARQLLPDVRRQRGVETGAVLERLYAAHGELCDTVALPNAPRDGFSDSVEQLIVRIDKVESELGRLLVVPEDELQAALEPYLMAIQLAGVEAEGELVDYLESLKPKPKEPTIQELMEAWHRLYQPRVAEAKGTLAAFLDARRRGQRERVGQSCRQISAEVIPLLDDQLIFRTPDPAPGAALRSAFVQLQNTAAHCTAGRFQEADQSLAEMQRALALAARRLAPYALSP